MSQEGFCDKHGPYEAHLGGCPYCEPASRQASGRPQRPPSLGEEPTGTFSGQPYNNMEETGVPNLRKGSGRGSLDETNFPLRGGGRGRTEDFDKTDFPRRRRGDGWDDDNFDLDSTAVDRPTRKGLLGWLVVKEGNRRGQFYELRDDYTIGRKQASVIIRDPKISQQHAKFRIKDDQFVIWDLASRNGTFVNGQEIMSPTLLQENDEIRVGDTVFVLKTLA